MYIGEKKPPLHLELKYLEGNYSKADLTFYGSFTCSHPSAKINDQISHGNVTKIAIKQIGGTTTHFAHEYYHMNFVSNVPLKFQVKPCLPMNLNEEKERKSIKLKNKFHGSTTLEQLDEMVTK